MRSPCDEAQIYSGVATTPCQKRQGIWILAATIIASSMAFIDSTVVNVALPALQNAFRVNAVDVQWVIEAYGLTLAALILVAGSLGDRFGRRRMFLLGVIVFASASVFCGVAHGIQQLIWARAVQGIGAAFLVPGSLALISASFDEAQRGRAIGTWSGSTAITTAVGPVLGGWLIQHVSWRWAFFINVPLAVTVIVLTRWRVPESRGGRAQKIDWMGAAAITLSLTGIVFGSVESSSLGWANPFIITSLVVGALGSVGFIFIELRVAFPMVPLDLFRSPAFRGANLLTFFLYAALGIVFFLLPLNLIQVQGYSPTAAGASILPLILLMFLLSSWSGGLVDRYGARMPLMIGPFVTSLGFLMLLLPKVGGSYWTTFFPAVVTLGLGMAVSVAPLTTVVMNAVDREYLGTASGINNALARVAGVLAVALLGAVMIAEFDNHLNRQITEMKLPASVRASLQANETRMGALNPPPGLEAHTQTAIRRSILDSFVFGFRLTMAICAGLALMSAATAWTFIPGKAARVIHSRGAVPL